MNITNYIYITYLNEMSKTILIRFDAVEDPSIDPNSICVRKHVQHKTYLTRLYLLQLKHNLTKPCTSTTYILYI
jgi:hypothetical protein